jgi:hypothetical protein
MRKLVDNMRPEEEIEEQFEEAMTLVAEGVNPYPGSNYVEGVKAALAWVLAEADDPPLELK